MNLYDAHNHLHGAWLAPHRDRVLADLAATGVRRAVVNGTDEADWPDVAALCAAPLSAPPADRPQQSADSVRLIPSFGLHPWDAGNRTPAWRERLVAALDAHPHAGVGEIGLDRWMLDRARPGDPRLAGLRRAPLDEQREVFLWQFALAAERDRAATIHCLDACDPLAAALAGAPRPARGFLLHAYAGPAGSVKRFADLGAYFSFNGSFLDPRRAARLQPVYAAIPADRLLVETDAPAMPLPRDDATHTLPPASDGSPVNHPANLAAAYAGLARWRGVAVDALAAQVERNFLRLFGP